MSVELKKVNRVQWLHPTIWNTRMSARQKLNEVNKFREALKLKPWKRLWGPGDKESWAGNIDEEIGDTLQDYFMGSDPVSGLSATVPPLAEDTHESPLSANDIVQFYECDTANVAKGRLRPMVNLRPSTCMRLTRWC